MLTIRLHFPWGRYYAHPWGQNPVRISEAEWPPSPWRLLRAIAAAWFRKNPGQAASPELLILVRTLGRELPVMQLPPVSFAKTVQYHPNPGVPSGKVRHENHFVGVGGDVKFRWALGNNPNQDRPGVAAQMKEVLDGLVDEIAYFGRAESVCDVTVTVGENELDPSACAAVVINDQKPGRRIAPDCRDVFCPDPDKFEAADLWQRRNGGTDPSLAPKHLVQDLLDTPQPLPDGAAWYSYQMPAGWPERWVIRHARPVSRKRDDSRIVAHFLEFSLQCRIPIPTKHVVSIASLFREAAIRNHRGPSFALSGRGRPDGLVGNHLHAFYLPVPNAEGNSLEILRVWCPKGFTQREVDALMTVEMLPWAGGRFPARPVLFHISCDLPGTEPAKRWRSLTPFVSPRNRYLKKNAEGLLRHRDTPEGQLERCLAMNGLTNSCISIKRSGGPEVGWTVCKVHLPPSARQSSERDHRIGLFFELEFPEPVRSPLPAFGHSCHFGLGQFVPSRKASERNEAE